MWSLIKKLFKGKKQEAPKLELVEEPPTIYRTQLDRMPRSIRLVPAPPQEQAPPPVRDLKREFKEWKSNISQYESLRKHLTA